MEQSVRIVTSRPQKPTHGTAGLTTQCPGECTTVSAVATATGGISSGNLITTFNNSTINKHG